MKMAILPKATTDSVQSSSKFQCNSSHKLKNISYGTSKVLYPDSDTGERRKYA